MIKKYIKALSIIFLLLFFNIGSKYPAMSETTNKSSVESYNEMIESEAAAARAESERYMKMYQEIYERSLIQQIEFESELIIPDRIDFKHVEYTYNLSREVGISSRVMFRLMFKESSFHYDVTSKVGAKGLMQLMPGTRSIYYAKLRVDTLNLDKYQEDIYIGANYLKELQELWRSRGNDEKNLLKLSLAAYNAGTEPVKKYKGVPPYKETQDFVNFILKSHSNPIFYSNIIQKSGKKDIA